MCINMSNQGIVNLMIGQVIVVFGLPGLRFMEETTLRLGSGICFKWIKGEGGHHYDKEACRTLP